MKWFLSVLSGKLRARAAIRRARAHRRAVADLNRRELNDGTIWRSGKGGSHYG